MPGTDPNVVVDARVVRLSQRLQNYHLNTGPQLDLGRPRLWSREGRGDVAGGVVGLRCANPTYSLGSSRLKRSSRLSRSGFQKQFERLERLERFERAADLGSVGRVSVA